jgi:hypothetical protein
MRAFANSTREISGGKAENIFSGGNFDSAIAVAFPSGAPIKIEAELLRNQNSANASVMPKIGALYLSVP